MTPNLFNVILHLTIITQQLPDDVWESVLCKFEQGLKITLPDNGRRLYCFLKSWRGLSRGHSKQEKRRTRSRKKDLGIKAAFKRQANERLEPETRKLIT
jgi:hypothetical protein